MDIIIGPVSRVFNSYKSQERMAELVKKNAVLTRQGQQDRVTISDQAVTLLKLAQINESPPRPVEPVSHHGPQPAGPPPAEPEALQIPGISDTTQE